MTRGFLKNRGKYVEYVHFEHGIERRTRVVHGRRKVSGNTSLFTSSMEQMGCNVTFSVLQRMI